MDSTEFLYDKLPGPRWIRVLALEPALTASDSLRANLEILELGLALPALPQIVGSVGYRVPVGTSYSAMMKDYYQRRDDHIALIKSRRMPYDALSYSWAMENGDTSFERSMTLSGRTTPITRNLAEALIKVRHASGSLRLWVDAVCINQTDVAERNAQVAMMFEIYTLARRVLIWLGNANVQAADYIFWHLAHCIRIHRLHEYNSPSGAGWASSSDAVLTALEAFVNINDQTGCTPETCTVDHGDRVLDTANFAPRSFEGKARFPEGFGMWLAADHEREAQLNKNLNMMMSMFRRRYWTRRWVVQENRAHIVSAGERHFYWGIYSVESSIMSTALDMLDVINSHLTKQRLITVDTLASHAMSALRIMDTGTSAPDLCQLLRYYSTTECADPRDRLYSLVALDRDHGISADYNLSLREVCMNLAKALVAYGDFRVLIAARHPSPDSSLNLPSWVPDLRSPFLRGPFGGIEGDQMRMRGQVADSATLSFETYMLGEILLAGPDAEYRQMVEIEPKGLEGVTGSTRLTRLKLRLGSTVAPEAWPTTRSGDSLFCLYEGRASEWYCSIMWLRPVPSQLSTYHLMAATDSCWIVGDELRREDLRVRPASKATVRIV